MCCANVKPLVIPVPPSEHRACDLHQKRSRYADGCGERLGPQRMKGPAHGSPPDRLTPTLLDATRPDIYDRLDRDFYDPRLATLTPAEQDLLLASAGCPYPPLRSSDLSGASAKTPGNVNVLLGRLVDAGALYRTHKGEYAYTAPKFRDYLLRRAAA
jgi:hypothetical protein